MLTRVGTTSDAHRRLGCLSAKAVSRHDHGGCRSRRRHAGLLERDFTATRPGVKFVGDITYIHTWAGFVYLATIIDCYSKKVVGWSIKDHMRTELVTDALNNAATTTLIEEDAVFHSDHGSVYTSNDYRTLVKTLKMRSSMGRTGVCSRQRDGRIILCSTQK